MDKKYFEKAAKTERHRTIQVCFMMIQFIKKYRPPIIPEFEVPSSLYETRKYWELKWLMAGDKRAAFQLSKDKIWLEWNGKTPAELPEKYNAEKISIKNTDELVSNIKDFRQYKAEETFIRLVHGQFR